MVFERKEDTKMSLMDELKDLGVNVDEALKRFMNNSSLYERMILKLTSAVKELEVMPYLESGNYEKALENSHTLKGIMGNMSVTPLYNAYKDILILLRDNKTEEAKDILEKVLPIQEKIISCINNYK